MLQLTQPARCLAPQFSLRIARSIIIELLQQILWLSLWYYEYTAHELCKLLLRKIKCIIFGVTTVTTRHGQLDQRYDQATRLPPSGALEQ